MCRASQGLLTESTPRTKFLFSGMWSLDNWNLFAGWTRYGFGDPGRQYVRGRSGTFGARWLLDTSVKLQP